MDLTIFVLGSYAVLVMTWVYYLAVMHLRIHRDRLHPVAKFHGYAFVLIPGLLLDAILNVVVASVFLLEVPREFLLTTRLKRLKKSRGWRSSVAHWVCAHLLNQFDPGHC